MKRILLSLLIILSSLQFLIAQNNDEVLLYKMISNEPFKSKNFTIGVDPIVADVFDPNISFSANLRASYRIHNRVSIEGSYRGAYFDRITADTNDDLEIGESSIMPTYKSRPAQEAEIMTRFYIINKAVDVEESVWVKTERKGSVNLSTLTEIPSKRAQLIALRIGYISGMYFGYSDADGPYEGHYVDNPGTVFGDGGAGKPFGSTVTYKVVALGISRTRLRNVEIDIEGYGKRDSKSYTEFYFDILYAPSIKFDNLYFAQNFNGLNGAATYSNYTEIDINDTKKLNAGARIGVTSYSLKPFGLYSGIETGIRPGKESILTQWYLQLKVGLNLNFKL